VIHISQSLKLWLKSFDQRSRGSSGQEGIRLLITSRHFWLTKSDQIEAPKSSLPYLCHHWADLLKSGLQASSGTRSQPATSAHQPWSLTRLKTDPPAGLSCRGGSAPLFIVIDRD
jgi:hypothetical protein